MTHHVLQHHRAYWDRQALEQREWSPPVKSAVLSAAKAGIQFVGDRDPSFAQQGVVRPRFADKQATPRFLIDQYLPTFIAPLAIKS
jgi:hypothetical protein